MGTLSCGSQVRRTRYLLRKGLLVGGPGLISVLALLAPDLGFLGRLGLPCRTGAIPASTSEQSFSRSGQGPPWMSPERPLSVFCPADRICTCEPCPRRSK